MLDRLPAPLQTAFAVVRTAVLGFWDDDGFILSGNLAYLALLALFPFMIFLVVLAGAIGRTTAGLEAVHAFLDAMPPNVATALADPINQVIGQSGRGLLTFGAVVAIWTAASFIETVRVIIHKAYNHESGRSMWQYRLESFVIVIGSAILLLLAMAGQFAYGAARKLALTYLPFAEGAIAALGWLRFGVLPLGLFLGLYGLFLSLTPRRARPRAHWPGAVLTTTAWIATAYLLPRVLAMLGSYDLTYGSLAGVMVALLFFYVVGAGLVMGAQLNAALKLLDENRKP